MSLDQYDKKRDLLHSPEPAPFGSSEKSDQLRFVIQKHQATHLHYDLRLEHSGVLKSWAVPKGPSLDPHVKRLAIEVEDHPLEYRNFEGIIPEGNYGAGVVMIWDEGSFTVKNREEHKNSDQAFSDAYNLGHIELLLSGTKLKGSFHLVKSSGKIKNSWILIKKSDQFSSGEDILLQNRSVRSGLTIEQIRAFSHLAPSRGKNEILKTSLRDAPIKVFKGPVRPMLAVLVEEAFDREGWIFEIKWDGYRAIAECLKSGVRLYSRNGKSFLSHYTLVVRELRKVDFEAVFDGEIVVVDEQGRSDFGALQNYRRTGAGQLVYYIFDLLYYEGHDLTGLPLQIRKKILSSVTDPSWNSIKVSNHLENRGKDLYNAASKNSLEGIMAKDGSAPYLPGIRSNQWQKIKLMKQQEMVVGGFSEAKGGRKFFGALLMGVYQSGKLKYTGSVGGGFSDDELKEIRTQLDLLTISESPFFDLPTTDSSTAKWVKPELVAVVRFSEWTKEGVMRQPVFLGFREDSDPRSVSREKPISINKKYSPSKDNEKTVIGEHTISLTNRNKIYFPNDSLSKGDVIDYYREVSPWILPHLINRPQSLHRFPDGIKGKEFFHKDIKAPPPWVQTYRIGDDPQEQTRYLICSDEASLIYMVNLGSIEINPWISSLGSLDYPDFSIIDLDPLDTPFTEVVRVAIEFHQLLDSIGASSFIKTSGLKGIHIYIPLGARYTYEQSRQFAMLLCHVVNRTLPATTSMERLPSRRRGRVYLDYLQNLKGKTMASVYSLRPVDGAQVSTPLHWEELEMSIRPGDFTTRTIMSRISKMGDIWRALLASEIEMGQCLERLGKIIYGTG